jgi:thiamine biosynthesis protein ThiS
MTTTPRDTDLIRITVNGEAREVPLATSVAALLDLLALPGKRVAVERNQEIVSRGRFAEEILADGDRVEIVQFVGGG